AGWKNLRSWFNGKVAEWVIDKPKGIYLSPYKVLRREVAELICRYDGPEPYVDGLLFQVTSRFAQVPIEHRPRHAGRSNYNLMRSIAVWSRLATGFSVRPLRLVTWCGLVLGFMGAFSPAAAACSGLPNRRVSGPPSPGWPPRWSTRPLLGGARLAFLAIL